MEDVNVTELRQNLPTYLDKVRRGRTIRVTLRGDVIAELCPPGASGTEAAAARALLKGSVLSYDRPLEPAGDSGEWDANK